MSAPMQRVSWPTVGGADSVGRERLAQFEAHDPTGRRWVSLYYFPDAGSDKAEPYFGPVIEETEKVISLDLDMGFPTRFLKHFCTIRRTA